LRKTVGIRLNLVFKTLFRMLRETVGTRANPVFAQTRKRTSVFATELNERFHQSNQCVPSLYQKKTQLFSGFVILMTCAFLVYQVMFYKIKPVSRVSCYQLRLNGF